MKLTDKKIGEMIKLLETNTLYQAGLAFDLDKTYSTAPSVKAAVKRYLDKSKVEPEKYGLTLEEVNKISTTLTARMLPFSKTNQVTLREKIDDENGKPFIDLVLSGRAKAMRLVHAKLDRIASSKKQLDETNLSTLAQTAGILFDKGQIVSGEATENVAVLAKIDKDISPEDAIKAVLQMRESFQVDKDRSIKKK